MDDQIQTACKFIPDTEFNQRRYDANLRAQELCWEFNMANPCRIQLRDKIIRKLIGKMGEDTRIVGPFQCGYGTNIEIGNDTYINMGATFLDEGKIHIGDRVAIGPNCNIYTVDHPIHYQEREGLLISSVIIEDDVWIGGNVTILRGVRIGKGAVIAAGSVIDYNVGSEVVAYGRGAKSDRSLKDFPFDFKEEYGHVQKSRISQFSDV